MAMIVLLVLFLPPDFDQLSLHRRCFFLLLVNIHLLLLLSYCLSILLGTHSIVVVPISTQEHAIKPKTCGASRANLSPISLISPTSCQSAFDIINCLTHGFYKVGVRLFWNILF